MRHFLCLAALAGALVGAVGCGKSASTGENWIFYTYTESTSDGKNTANYTVEECVNVKFVTQATYYPPEASSEKEKQSFLWMKCAGKEVKLYGKDADAIWKSLKSNN